MLALSAVHEIFATAIDHSASTLPGLWQLLFFPAGFAFLLFDISETDSEFLFLSFTIPVPRQVMNGWRTSWTSQGAVVQQTRASDTVRMLDC